MIGPRRAIGWSIAALAAVGLITTLVFQTGPAQRSTPGAKPAPNPEAQRVTDGDATRPPAGASPAAPDAPLWSPVDESDVDPLPHYAPQWSAEGRILVRVAEATRAAPGWRVGDRLTLPLPQLGVVYQPAIEELKVGPGPSMSALGKVAGDDGQRRRFVVTVGPAHVFAYMDTPRGPYELTGGGEFGWLLPSSSMMAGFDYSKPDYILPGRRGAGNTP